MTWTADYLLGRDLVNKHGARWKVIEVWPDRRELRAVCKGVAGVWTFGKVSRALGMGWLRLE